MISKRSVIVLALAAVLSLGCGGAITASLAHPARVGRVMPHALVRHDRNGEGTGFGAQLMAAANSSGTRRLPPGALDDAVRLVRFDEAGVCFDLISRHTEPTAIDFRNGLNAQLFNYPSGTAVTTMPVVVGSPPRAHTEMAQTEVQVQDGWETGCDSDGCWRQATYGTETRDVAAAVYETRTLFCFPNDGTLTPATQALELALPHGRFRWQFDAPANGWAQPVITMEPIYIGPTNQLLQMAPTPAGGTASLEAVVARW